MRCLCWRSGDDDDDAGRRKGPKDLSKKEARHFEKRFAELSEGGAAEIARLQDMVSKPHSLSVCATGHDNDSWIKCAMI